jgi:hypothetical protein
MPTARHGQVGAVVNNILYVIGGYLNGNSFECRGGLRPHQQHLVHEIPHANSKSQHGRGGERRNHLRHWRRYERHGRLTTVESYNPATDTWAEEAPLPVGVSGVAAGLLGSTIVAAGGQANSGNDVTDTEGYNPSTNSWETLAPDPTEQQAGCFRPSRGSCIPPVESITADL